MKRASVIAVLTYLAFLAEFVLYNAFGAWGKPELVVLVIVFCCLYWGIRHSLWAAFIAGLLKDSFGIEPFGTYLFVYIAAAYLTTLIRQNLYQPGSRFSRAVVTFFVLVAIFILETLLHIRSFEVRLTEALAFILLPQVVITMVATTFVFHWLRDVVVKLKL
jgi:rod shape-determining protein MreD